VDLLISHPACDVNRVSLTLNLLQPFGLIPHADDSSHGNWLNNILSSVFFKTKPSRE
jgi:hypothetical protein